jgi:hypothetical protein
MKLRFPCASSNTTQAEKTLFESKVRGNKMTFQVSSLSDKYISTRLCEKSILFFYLYLPYLSQNTTSNGRLARECVSNKQEEASFRDLI